jgi:nicotinamidase-related amidase/type 1 glutamine amidotransferase
MRRLHRWSLLSLLPLVVQVTALPARADSLVLHTRSRVEASPGSGQLQQVAKLKEWDPNRTAVVVCDMWDHHWCQGASARVAEMAPRMNEVLKAVRRQGVLVIHCPSDTLKFYEGTPQRRLAQAAPKVASRNWAGLDRAREGALPIDDSDGGCDDLPRCQEGAPWTRQIETLQVEARDAITDSAEIYGLMEERGIDNVLILGVHLNMCVLGRPFGIRQLVRQGKNVVLVRDLTDTMYNSRKRPFVSHFAGTDLMIKHVERYWCPTITSVDLVGGEPFRFQADRRPNLVFLIGEDEYRTAETLPEFAQRELAPRGFRVEIIQDSPGDKGNFVGLIEALSKADGLLVSLRRRALPKAQLDAIRAHLEAGKPLIGIRTASHAFAPRDQEREEFVVKGGRAEWPRFDPEVLGGNYGGHHGSGVRTTLRPAPRAEDHPILSGVDVTPFSTPGTLYRVSPLAGSATPLLIGSVPGQPEEPVAWVHAYGPKQARVFYTSLGHPEDFAQSAFCRLLLNGIAWALNRASSPNEAQPTAGASR